jgi:transposase
MASNSELALITKLLDIEGMKVKNYSLIPGIGVLIYLKSQEKKVVCPRCGKKTDKLHQNREYTVRDLPISQQPVYLKVNRRRLRCPSCQKIFAEKFNWVKKRKTYTERFKTKILTEVLESDIKNVAGRNDVSEQEIETMLKEVGEELVAEKPQEIKRLGIDEIALVKGQKNYCAVLVDLDERVIVGILPKRTKEEVRKHLESWGEEVLGQIEEVSIDFWKPYQTVVSEVISQAEIVADRFHVMKQINDELDQARRKAKREAKKIKKKTERESVNEGLTKSKYVLLKNESELSERELEKLKEVQKVAPELGKMHQLKEEFRKIFEDSNNWKKGLLSFGDWLTEAWDYFPKSSRTIRRWIGEIITYFDHRTSQGVVEGINNKIKLIKRRAFGFRNFDNFRIRCFVNWHFAC